MFQRNLAPSGALMAQVIRAAGPGILWKIRNAPNLWRGWSKVMLASMLRLPTFYGTLDLCLVRADGTRVNYGRVSYRVVTTAYVTALATYQFDGSGIAPTAFDYHDCGTGTTAEASGDTALVTPYGGARTNGTPSNPGAGQYRNAGTISFTGTAAITEHGVFSASSTGTLLDRSVFSAINVVNGDSIAFTYTLTYSAGG